MVVTKALLDQQNGFVYIDGHDRLVVLRDFPLEALVGIFIVHRCIWTGGLFLKESEFLFDPLHQIVSVRGMRRLQKSPQGFDEHFLLLEHLGLHLVESRLFNKLENVFSHQLVKRLTLSDESDEVLLHFPLYPLAVSLAFLGRREHPE
jgi:hypothetical protein